MAMLRFIATGNASITCTGGFCWAFCQAQKEDPDAVFGQHVSDETEKIVLVFWRTQQQADSTPHCHL